MKLSDFSTPQGAEDAFYAAFAECDYKAMETIWALDDIVCIHPGSSALIGRGAVMRSWANMLLNAEPPMIRINVLSRITGNDLVVHVVEEHITSGYGDTASVSLVQATNVYRKEGGEWRLLEHHASMPRLQRSDAGKAPHKHTLQ